MDPGKSLNVAPEEDWLTQNVMFSCLSSKAVHIDVVEELSSSSFINALTRFVVIRGRVQEFRSDRGMNFLGTTESLGVNAINVEDGPVGQFLLDKRAVWIFNLHTHPTWAAHGRG